jgi:hypothetical protein
MADTQMDYNHYLSQGMYWPSESKGEDLLIAGMAPQHALAAYLKCKSIFQDASTNEWPLLRALLNQAVGEPVTLNKDIPAPTGVSFSYRLTLEDAFDIMSRMDDLVDPDGIGPDVHPVTRAKYLMSVVEQIRKDGSHAGS